MEVLQRAAILPFVHGRRCRLLGGLTDLLCPLPGHLLPSPASSSLDFFVSTDSIAQRRTRVKPVLHEG
jgi:hypothetical protein